MKPRAVIFDLDDTLYPARRFALSGFAAVSQHLFERFGAAARSAFAILLRELKAGRQATAFQAVCRSHDLPIDLVPDMVAVMRAHRPRLRLPTSSRRTLMTLRPRWRLGVLTNGLPAMQARKVDALHIRPLVDAVVFARDHGQRVGKPDPGAFWAVTRSLGVAPGDCVFVGDDPECDIAAARRVGMATIRVAPARHPMDDDGADAFVTSVDEVPEALARLTRQAVARAV